MNYKETKQHHLSILTSQEKKSYMNAIWALEKSYDEGLSGYVVNAYDELSEDLQELFDTLAVFLFPSWRN